MVTALHAQSTADVRAQRLWCGEPSNSCDLAVAQQRCDTCCCGRSCGAPALLLEWHFGCPFHLPQVFVTAQARTIDLATVLAQGSGLLVLVSPGMKQQLVERLDKYIFPGDQVGS